LTLYQLKIFEAVARHLNITRASLELHASQPAVSKQLKLLEEDFRATLLLRHNYGVKLTDKGRAFLEAIRPILADLDDIGRRFKKDQSKKPPQRLAIGGSHSVCLGVLPTLLKAFKEKHPSIEFTLAANESSVILNHLLKSELDLAIMTNPSQVEGLIYEPFVRMEVVAFCLPTNPAAGKTLTLKELAEYPLVLKSGGSIESLLTRQRYKMNFTLRCEAYQVVKTAVRMGMGIGILYRDVVVSNLARGNLKLIHVPELKEIGMTSVVVYDGRKPLSPIARDFLALLREKKERAQKIEERVILRTSAVSGRERKVTKPQHAAAKTARKYPSLHLR
jgi:DNA-binding transcriptional LysR family regulator